MKTAPFSKWLKSKDDAQNMVIYYGFDKDEAARVERRERIMKEQGYETDYPLFSWESLPVKSTREIGIEPPMKYSQFSHANCTGCLKAGAQHWYIVYCERPDIFERAKLAEKNIGYSILKSGFLKEQELKFKQMKDIGIVPEEITQHQTFWAKVRRALRDPEAFKNEEETIPCMCK